MFAIETVDSSCEKKALIVLILFLLLPGFLCSEVTFSDINLSPSNQLLFRATAKLPGIGAYDTLFSAQVSTRAIQQLSYFPEKVALLSNGETLQVQNRFGVFRSVDNFRTLTPITLFPAFIHGAQIQSGKISPIITSYDGEFLLYTKQSSWANGKLVLFDMKLAEELVVSEGVELSLTSPQAIWSPDSRYFIYEKNQQLYYFAIDQYREKRILAENYRKIGDGKMANIRWGRGNDLFYVSHNVVFRLDSRELFTRALYSGFLKIGEIRGKIPFIFDANFDNYWISPDGNKILLNKEGRNLFFYFLQNEDFHTTGSTLSLPYLYLPRNTIIKSIVWAESDIITLLAIGIEKGKTRASVFRLSLKDDGMNMPYVRTDDKDITNIVLSPDEENIATLTADAVEIRDYETWEVVRRITHPQPLHVLWVSDRSFLIAGTFYTEMYDMIREESTLVTISQVDDFGFSYDFKNILAQVQGRVFKYLPDFTAWEEVEEYAVSDTRVASASFRVYLEASSRGSYLSMVMVRDVKGFGTQPLFPSEKTEYESFPDQDEKVDFINFVHGSRIRRREVSLVFNAVDSIEGLTFILNTLAEYRLKATFFVNGEIIRRYPAAVREIAESGHEVGSLFYVYFNMTDSRFHVDKEFIKGGLAKNEDDYFVVTGRELSLHWHAPYYFVNSDIIGASKEMNYTYVGRDVDPLDWVIKTETYLSSGIYATSAKLVERILNLKKPGSIIPILVGIGEGNRDDYLFHKLDLLINGLIRLGYTIVPVSTLTEHAR